MKKLKNEIRFLLCKIHGNLNYSFLSEIEIVFLFTTRGVKGQRYFDRVRSRVKKIKRHMPKVTQRSLKGHLETLSGSSNPIFGSSNPSVGARIPSRIGNCCTGEWWYLIYVEFYVTYGRPLRMGQRPWPTRPWPMTFVTHKWWVIGQTVDTSSRTRNE